MPAIMSEGSADSEASHSSAPSGARTKLDTLRGYCGPGRREDRFMKIEFAEGVWALQVPTASLGDHSYVVVARGVAAVVDPQRDIERFLAALGDARLSAVAETHVHNDYVTGGSLLAARREARYVLPAGSGALLDHVAVAEGDTVALGEGWGLVAIHTPGHTPHHMSYVLHGPDGPVAVFSGGSMLVGAVGRTDLVDPELTDRLTRDQHRSVRRLAAGLDDPVAVAPTHGAGSFCAASPISDTTSTIGRERRQNPALLMDDEDHFVASQVAGFLAYPTYYAHMAPINRTGPTPIAEPPPALTADELKATDALIVDVRSASSFAAGHVPGSISIPISESTGTYAGWVLPWNTPVVLVGDGPEDVEEARLQLARIGYDRIAGIVADGLAGWVAAGNNPASFRAADWGDFMRERPALLLDVRDPREATQRIAGARPAHVADLDGRSYPDGDVWVHCASGFRAAIAVSLLRARGRDAVAILADFDDFPGPRVPA
jgi:glyoxylase-like metal-dependent hydrolase (beta-lactamase superfamily II)/rhodanese-related sulfurtransferase